MIAALQIAQDYRKYLDNAEDINLRLALAPNTPFSVGWTATLLQAEAMGLSQAIDYDGEAIGDTVGTEIFTSIGDDIVKGAGGGDWIRTYDGDDALHGGAGDDALDGGAGADALFGDAGDDALMGAEGADVIDGGAGVDTAIFEGRIEDYDVHEQTGGGYQVVARHRGDETDILTNIEKARFGVGESFTDYAIADVVTQNLTGTSASETLEGRENTDTLDGGAGDDVLFGYGSADTLSGGDGRDLLYGGAGNDVLDAAARRAGGSIFTARRGTTSTATPSRAVWSISGRLRRTPRRASRTASCSATLPCRM